MPKNLTYLLLSLMLISLSSNASTGKDWHIYKKLVIEKCIAQSHLTHAKPLGEVMLFDDHVGFDALLLQDSSSPVKTSKPIAIAETVNKIV